MLACTKERPSNAARSAPLAVLVRLVGCEDRNEEAG